MKDWSSSASQYSHEISMIMKDNKNLRADYGTAGRYALSLIDILIADGGNKEEIVERIKLLETEDEWGIYNSEIIDEEFLCYIIKARMEQVNNFSEREKEDKIRKDLLEEVDKKEEMIHSLSNELETTIEELETIKREAQEKQIELEEKIVISSKNEALEQKIIDLENDKLSLENQLANKNKEVKVVKVDSSGEELIYDEIVMKLVTKTEYDKNRGDN